MVEKTRCSGQWTEARFRSFVISALRNASMRWRPKNECLKEARIDRGKYLCNGCKAVVPASVVINGKRVKNIYADHIHPVVDPKEGFTTWDNFIERLFVEKDGYQALCKACHDEKSKEERKQRNKRGT